MKKVVLLMMILLLTGCRSKMTSKTCEISEEGSVPKFTYQYFSDGKTVNKMKAIIVYDLSLMGIESKNLSEEKKIQQKKERKR